MDKSKSKDYKNKSKSNKKNLDIKKVKIIMPTVPVTVTTTNQRPDNQPSSSATEPHMLYTPLRYGLPPNYKSPQNTQCPDQTQGDPHNVPLQIVFPLSPSLSSPTLTPSPTIKETTQASKQPTILRRNPTRSTTAPSTTTTTTIKNTITSTTTASTSKKTTTPPNPKKRKIDEEATTSTGKGKKTASTSRNSKTAASTSRNSKIAASKKLINRKRVMEERRVMPTRYPDPFLLSSLGMESDFNWLCDQLGMLYLMTNRWPTYVELTHSFLLNFECQVNHTDEGRISFSIFNKPYVLTLQEFASIYKLPVTGERLVTHKFNVKSLWAALSGYHNFSPATNRSTHIKHPCFRYFFRVLASTIFARDNCEMVARVDELFALWSAFNPPACNIASFLARQFHTAAISPVKVIRIGGLITPIAKYLKIPLDNLTVVSGTTTLTIASCLAMKIIDSSPHGYCVNYGEGRVFSLPYSMDFSIRDKGNWMRTFRDSPIEKEANIGEEVQVGEEVDIGEEVSVGEEVDIGDDVGVGEEAHVEEDVYVGEDVCVGEEVHVEEEVYVREGVNNDNNQLTEILAQLKKLTDIVEPLAALLLPKEPNDAPSGK